MNNNFIVKGTIYMTDDLRIISIAPDDVKIISLDEDNRISPNNPNVIVGTCLLPPMEALIAEADGDEGLYDMCYINHLNSPYIQSFIGAIISALYKGISFLVYVPSLRDTFFISKLRIHLWTLYGISIGISNVEQCQFDIHCIPIWLNLMYFANVIDYTEYLFMYPDNTQFNNMAIDKLILDMKPFADSYESRLKVIKSFQQKLKQRENTQIAIFDMRIGG